MTQEQAAWTFGQEGLDQGTRLWADRRQAAFPGEQRRDARSKTALIPKGEICGLAEFYIFASEQQVLSPIIVCGQAEILFSSLNKYSETTTEQSTEPHKCYKERNRSFQAY